MKNLVGGAKITITELQDNLNPVLKRTGRRLEFKRTANPIFKIYNAENQLLFGFASSGFLEGVDFDLMTLHKELSDSVTSPSQLTLEQLPKLREAIELAEEDIKALSPEQIARLIVVMKSLGVQIKESSLPESFHIRFYDGKTHHEPKSTTHGAKMYYIALNVNLSDHFLEEDLGQSDDKLKAMISDWITKSGTFAYKREQTDAEIAEAARKLSVGYSSRSNWDPWAGVY